MTAVSIRTAAILLLLSLSIVKTEIVDKRSLKYGQVRPVKDISVNKVILTQKGYIQFLQYIADVPIITEYTFCIWINSVNYTHSHPLLSYSRFDTESLIRAWITPGGENLNLEILENKIFSVRVDLVEHHWYHICQSWSSSTGIWMAFRNGQVLDMGNSHEMHMVRIPDGGEIVVGQEYTDFDKGLDDGIEGHIYGFNLVLAAASSSLTSPNNQRSFFLHQNNLGRRRQLQQPSSLKPSTSSRNIYKEPPQFHNYGYDLKHELKFTNSKTNSEIATQTDVPEVLRYFDTALNRNPKRVYGFGKDALNMYKLVHVNKPTQTVPELSYIKPNEKRNYGIYYAPRHVQYAQDAYTSPSQQLYPAKRIFSVNDGSLFPETASNTKPLGLILVELGYNFCALGNGSPIKDKRLLISWTKTPVRVFGGAILKNDVPFCLQPSWKIR